MLEGQNKKKLQSQKSIQKGGALTAAQAHEKIQVKCQKEQEEAEKKANRAITKAVWVAEKAHHQCGIDAQQAKHEQKAKVKELQVKGEPVPENLLIPICDPEKNPTPEELEALKCPSIIPINPLILSKNQGNIGDDGGSDIEIIIDQNDLGDESVVESEYSYFSDDSMNDDFIPFNF
jgi:hypothetical protein